MRLAQQFGSPGATLLSGERPTMFAEDQGVYRESGVASIIRVTSDLDASTNADLLAMIAEAEIAPILAKRIVVDLSRCTYCDSGAVGSLLRTHRRLGQRFFIVLPPASACARIFKILGIDKFPFVVEAMDHALHS